MNHFPPLNHFTWSLRTHVSYLQVFIPNYVCILCIFTTFCVYLCSVVCLPVFNPFCVQPYIYALYICFSVLLCGLASCVQSILCLVLNGGQWCYVFRRYFTLFCRLCVLSSCALSILCLVLYGSQWCYVFRTSDLYVFSFIRCSIHSVFNYIRRSVHFVFSPFCF